MKHLVILSALFTLLGSCNNDKEGNLIVVFEPVYGSDPLLMFDTNPYAFDQEIQFTRSDMLISNIQLVRDDNTAQTLSEVEVFNMEFTSVQDAENGRELGFKNIPEGHYKSIRFGIGLDPVLNATHPSDYPSSHPLSDAGRYWDAWDSYVFTRIEGNLDTLMDGVSNPDLGFLYHTGSDALYRQVEAPVSVDIKDGSATRLIFRVDHQALLGLPDAPIDIKAKPRNHNPADTLQIKALIDHYPDALSYYVE